MPNWVASGFDEYVKRLPKTFRINLHELAMPKRAKSCDLARAIAQEGIQLLTKVAPHSLIIALDEYGKELTTHELAGKLAAWHNTSQNISLLVGGPDGLAKEVLTKANFVWSLSKLTLPHPLVRVVVAEQIYRAWSIINRHPYHRE